MSRKRKLKEERQIEELKKLQVEAGLIPESHLERLDFIYKEAPNKETKNTIDDYFDKELKKTANSKFKPKDENSCNPLNDQFTKNYEDPLFYIKQEELKKKKQLTENPLKMKQILSEIENEIKKERKNSERKSNKNSGIRQFDELRLNSEKKRDDHSIEHEKLENMKYGLIGHSKNKEKDFKKRGFQ